MTSDELRRFGGMTLGEILQRVTGLTGTSQYFTDRSMRFTARRFARVWLPSWEFTSVDTIAVEQGRVVYIGLQFSAGKN